jgi:glycosyltransferase involved in cell wall biosynthesis
MIDAGHEVWCMAPEEGQDLIDEVAKLGAKYESVPFSRASMNLLHDLRGSRAFAARLAKIQPDVVLSYVVRTAIWGTLAAKKAGVPRRVAMLTGIGTAFTMSGIKGAAMNLVAKTLLRISFRHVHQVIVQNPDDRDAILATGAVKPELMAIVNGSGVNLAEFPCQPMPEGIPRILIIARLVVDKGVREFVEAARIVKSVRPEVVFDIVGLLEDHISGIKESEVQTWVTEGLIQYHGAQWDVLPYLRNCTIYCLPSYREGTPRSVLEALAVGRPIVTTDVPGCRETIDHGVEGLLVPVRDSPALAKAILDLLEEPARLDSMAAKARERAEEKYDVHKVNQEMLRLMGLSR